MTVNSQVVRFNKSTGANGTTQDVGLNFTPKAIIVISDGGAGADGSSEAEYQWCVGFSDGTNHACFCIGSDDGSAASDTGRIHSNADVFIRLSQSVPTTTVNSRGSVAFQTNNLRFTWTVNDAVATKIVVWAFGGSDITGVKVNTVDLNETVDGATEDYTGLGFTPNGDSNTALFMLGIDHTANSSTTPTTAATGMFTFATTAGFSTKQFYMVNNPENGADPSDTWRAHGGDRNYITYNGTGLFDAWGFLSDWITDGFRMHWDNAHTSSTIKMSYLVINGGNWDSEVLTAPTSATNDVDYTVSVNSKPIKGLMLASVSDTQNGQFTATAQYTMGITDGTTSAVIASIDEDNQPTMDSYRYHDSTSLYYTLTTDGALTDRATFDSFSTNNFRLDYPTKSASAQLIGWIVVADQFDAAVDVEVSYQSYGNIHQSFDSNKNAIYG